MASTLKKGTKLGKPSKHDVLAHLFQFVHYVEDYIVVIKRFHKGLDVSLLKQKAQQCKEILQKASET